MRQMLVSKAHTFFKNQSYWRLLDDNRVLDTATSETNKFTFSPNGFLRVNLDLLCFAESSGLVTVFWGKLTTEMIQSDNMTQ